MISSASLYEFDRTLRAKGFQALIGIDEAGRGPLAGPVIAAAVLLDPEKPIEGVNDSKKLNESSREKLYEQIISQATAWAVGSSEHDEIDRVNILQATFLAMERALNQIQCGRSVALIDGNREHPRIRPGCQMAIIDGDAKSASIAAASIIAKVTRDRIMKKYHDRYPVYDFFQNKGYATELHRTRLLEHGMCEIHRKTFCVPLMIQTKLAI